MYLRTADVCAEINLPESNKMAMPGDNLMVNLKLNFPLPITVGKPTYFFF